MSEQRSSNPLCAELRSIAQNEYMIDQHYLARGHTMNEAADEIERLTSRIAELEKAPGEQVFRGVMADNAEIAAENDRLRAALDGALAYIRLDSELPPMLPKWEAALAGAADETKGS